MNKNRDHRIFNQRNLIGAATIVCLLGAGYLLFFSEGETSSVGGILVKVGLMLAAIWLAYPVLQASDRRFSLLSLAVLLVLLVLVAARPRIFLIAFAVAVVALAINWVLLRINQRG